MATTKRATVGTTRKAPLGQNFLTDSSAALKIVDALGDVTETVAVEIGPGRGALTQLLARRAGRLIAIELDRLLSTQLRFNYSRQPHVEIIEGDVLKLDFRTVLNRTIGPLNDLRPLKPARARVVGNLPYYITSEILLRLFEFHDQFDVIVIMVQREVADRIAAKPGSRDYGLLSATAQLYTSVENLFTLPPDAFLPPPKVHSSVLRLTVAPRFAELQVKPAEFVTFLKTAFAMKRKTLMNNLREKYGEEKVRSVLKEAAIRPDIRAEALPLERSAEIFRRLSGIG
ncbi:MAG TPA: 16S rRNA (adenine(1518)-N(6)/adenine(1519)-N(6))-dimethyltransferase RsmA [Candidatus Angelobacter sp.]|nr:16S rRNA (adenine(1518)-N(6)/adenine(1519)-N(6))-dimethyltransferase RsmA [Candidatus Angelobacter sp.]